MVRESEPACHTFDEVCEAIADASKRREVILGADRAVVLSGEWMNLQEKFQAGRSRMVYIAAM